MGFLRRREFISLGNVVRISRRKSPNSPFQVQEEGSGGCHRQCIPMLHVQCARKKKTEQILHELATMPSIIASESRFIIYRHRVVMG